MEDNILKSTKKILGVSDDYDAFDLDIITHINSVLSILNQLGVGTPDFMIEDESANWEDFLESSSGLQMVKSYVYLKVRLLFDPPRTSFEITAMENQIKEQEYRILYQREWNANPVDPYPPVVEEV